MTTFIQKLTVVLIVIAGALSLATASALTASASPVSTYFAATCSAGEVTADFDENVCCPSGSQASGMSCFMSKYLNPVIALLAAVVGIVVVISIIIGGIQYSSAAGDPGKIQAAKQRIMNAIIALIAFFFLFAGLSWLIPGGL